MMGKIAAEPVVSVFINLEKKLLETWSLEWMQILSEADFHFGQGLLKSSVFTRLPSTPSPLVSPNTHVSSSLRLSSAKSLSKALKNFMMFWFFFLNSQTKDCERVNRSDPSFSKIVARTEDLFSYLQLVELFLPLLVMCVVSWRLGKDERPSLPKLLGPLFLSQRNRWAHPHFQT